jgi:hypothetical protein
MSNSVVAAPITGLRLLSDEDVPGSIVRGLRSRHPGLDIVRVQEVGLMQTPDPDILAWATREGRLIVTRDVNTMSAYALERVALGLPMLGVFVIPERMPVGQAIRELEIIALASSPDEWRDRVAFLPI